MSSRRTFLKGSLATAGIALAGSAFLRSNRATMPTPYGPHLKLHGVVFEPRFAVSSRFAAEAERSGLSTFDIEDDITPTWTRLVDLWRTTPVAVGGLTTLMPLVLLEQSARDHGMRFAFRAEHRPVPNGQMDHAFDGPAEAIDAFSLSARLRRDHGTCIARALLQCPLASGSRTAISLRTPIDTREAAVPMYSWLLVPRHYYSQGAYA